MRRLSLSKKLLAAALPLLLAVTALLALTVRSDLNEVNRAQSGAELGATWEPLIAAMTSIEAELAETNSSLISAGSSAVDITALAPSRRATDQAINDLREQIETLGAFEAASEHITSSRSSLSAARRNIDMTALAPDMAVEINPLIAYDTAGRELVSVGQLLPAEAGNADLGRELLAVVKLAEANLAANGVIFNVQEWQSDPSDTAPLTAARAEFSELAAVLGEFEAIAPEDWAVQYRQSGFPSDITGFRSQLDSVTRAANQGRVEDFDTRGFAELIGQGVVFQVELADSIVEGADAAVASTRQASLTRIGIILGAVLIAMLIAWLITRSVTRRIKAVSAGANQVASEQLPALVEAISDPRGKAVMPEVKPVNAKGADELAELADSFNAMQNTLIDVAQQQIEVLRRGVSDIFVTMARRNRSLIDRQLAMLDEYEAEVDDPDVLAKYYQLDHLSTRMRRNSESLLVLANADTKRRRVKATEIDDVVRASLGEVEDYRRIEVEALESLQVRGNVVADVSHMLAELLDNATSFSPPDSTVRVGGKLTADNTYVLRILDTGVGIGAERLDELNELLRDPPFVGLAVESTLGMSVVSLLANKHDIDVTLSAANPGLIVDIVLPSSLFGPIDVPTEEFGPAPARPEHLQAEAVLPTVETLVVEEPAVEAPTVEEPAVEAPVAEEPMVVAPVAEAPAGQESFTPDDFDTYERQPEPAAASDWTTMSIDLDALTMPTAETTEVDETEPTAEPLPTPSIEPDSLAGPSLPAPPTADRLQGEFDQPPTPPLAANALNQRPVVPSDALPLPARDSVPADDTPGLPTRGRGQAPDGGPDRLAAATPADENPAAPANEPTALQTALSAFNNRTNGDGTSSAGGGKLPSRSPGAESAGTAMIDESSATTQSRLDPEALRERLRAFQTEFRSGHSAEQSNKNDTDSREDSK